MVGSASGDGSVGDGSVVGHPLVHAHGSGFVVSETDAAVVDWSSARAGLLRDAAESGTRVVLLTAEDTTMTFALTQALRLTGGSWVVRTNGGCRSAAGVTVAPDVTTALQSEPAPVLPPAAFDGTDGTAGRPWVECVVSVHHPAGAEAVIGRTLELVLDGLVGAAPDAWGVSEPASLAWDVAALTAYVRGRMPSPTRLVAHGAVAGGAAAATIRVERTDRGVTEETKLALALPGGPGSVDVIGRVPQVLASVATRQRVLLATGWELRGSAAATFTASPGVVPSPIGAVIGSRAVRDLGLDTARVEAIEDAWTVGSARVPSVVVSFVDADGALPVGAGAVSSGDVAGVVSSRFVAGVVSSRDVAGRRGSAVAADGGAHDDARP